MLNKFSNAQFEPQHKPWVRHLCAQNSAQENENSFGGQGHLHICIFVNVQQIMSGDLQFLSYKIEVRGLQLYLEYVDFVLCLRAIQHKPSISNSFQKEEPQ